MIGYRFIENYVNLNNFDVVDTKEFVPDQDSEIFFQTAMDTGLRYLPASGATIEVTFEHIDSSKVVKRPATQVIPTDDRSIWKVQILPGETIAAGSMKVVLTEGSNKKTLPALSDFVVAPSNRFFC